MAHAEVTPVNKKPSRFRWAKKAAKGIIGSRLLYPMLHRLSDARNGITILTYHALGHDHEPFDAWVVARLGDFERQIASIRERYEIVSLDTAARLIGRKTRPLAVVTFDDGHESLFHHLLPIARRLELPVTVYVSTGHVQNQSPYWFDRLANALQIALPEVIDLSGFELGKWRAGFSIGEENWNEVSPLFEALKQLSPSLRDEIVRALLEQLERRTRRAITPLLPMSVAQVSAIGRTPWITIGAHSHCHNLLDQLSLPEAELSMRMSRDLLREWTGQDVLHFAYPNGNFTPELAAAAHRVGFSSAVTTQNGVWTAGDNMYALPRVSIGRYDGVSGLQWLLLKAVRASRGAVRPKAQVHPVLHR